MTSRPFKVGILTDTLTVDSYIYDLADRCRRAGNIEPVVLHGYNAREKKGLAGQFKDRLLAAGPIAAINNAIFSILLRLIRKYEIPRARRKFPRYGSMHSLANMDITTLTVAADWSRSGLVARFTEESLERIRAEKFDVILRAGNGILKGGILNAARLGMLSFHHGDNRVNRGGPSGFWEVFFREPSSGFVLQRLTEELDGGEVLLRGNIPTSAFWALNNATLLEKSYPFLFRYLRQMAAGEAPAPEDQPALYDRTLLKFERKPGLLLRYIYKTYAPFVKRQVGEMFAGRKEVRWRLAFAPTGDLNRSLFRYTPIANPPGRFLADPFVLTHSGRSVCFAEDYFFEDGRGRISAIDLTTGKPEFLGVVLDETFHLSYPYMFEVDGQAYMIPESHEAGEIRLYRAVDFPMQWELDTVLMKGVEAVDVNLVRQGQRWFMLCNICSASIHDFGSELHMFHADDFRSTSWQPCAHNPQIFDSRDARNGGLFEHSGTLYRVNQKQGLAHYGAGFGLNAVEDISDRGFRERRVDDVRPDFFPEAVSSHHFHADEHFAVLDFARRERLRSILAETND